MRLKPHKTKKPDALSIAIGVLLVVYVIGLFFTQTYPSRIGVFFLTAVLSMVVLPALYPVCCAISKIGGGEPWKE